MRGGVGGERHSQRGLYESFYFNTLNHYFDKNYIFFFPSAVFICTSVWNGEKIHTNFSQIKGVNECISCF